MRKLILLLLLLPVLAGATNYFVSPTGSDALGDGSIGNPWFSINQGKTSISGGDTLFMRGGTYNYDTLQGWNNRNGSAGSPMCLCNYPGEYPVLTPTSNWATSGYKIGLWIYNCDYVYIRGLEITGYKQKSSAYHFGFVVEASSYVSIEYCNVHHNGFGLSIGDGSAPGTKTDFNVRYCDFWSNSDSLSASPWGGADGLTVRISNDTNCVVNIVGCRMWYNSDDGVDLFNFVGRITFTDTWAFWNGYKPDRKVASGGDGTGFKSGPTYDYESGTYYPGIRRTYNRCLSVENVDVGWTQNYAATGIANYNCVSLGNSRGYILNHIRGEYDALFNPTSMNHEIDHRLVNCVSLNPVLTDSVRHAGLTDYCILATNTFGYEPYESGYGGYGITSDSIHVSNADFASVSSVGMDGARKSNGDLPDLNLLRLVSTSDLIDAGTDVGLYFYGTAPDIGAFEYVPPRPVKTPGYVQKAKLLKSDGKFIR